MTTETDHLVALARLQSRYADVITRRAWDELAEVFLPDTVVHLDTVTSPPRDLIGPDGFIEVISNAMARFDHFTFVILNAVCELDADWDDADPDDHVAAADRVIGARGRIFMCEIRHERESDEWSTAHGLYEDRYVHGAGRWRIAERHYRSLARTGSGGAVFGLPPGLGPLGR